MEGLKSTIDNTNKYKNDLKLARNKINERILSGGGTIASSISAVPEAIDKMLKENYKKIAVLTLNKEFTGLYTSIKTLSFSFNVDFNPKEAFLICQAKRDDNKQEYEGYFIVDSKHDCNAMVFYTNPYSQSVKFDNFKISNGNEIEFSVAIRYLGVSESGLRWNLKIEEVILIE